MRKNNQPKNFGLDLILQYTPLKSANSVSITPKFKK